MVPIMSNPINNRLTVDYLGENLLEKGKNKERQCKCVKVAWDIGGKGISSGSKER